MLTVKGIEKRRERYKAREIVPNPNALTALMNVLGRPCTKLVPQHLHAGTKITVEL